MEIVLKRPPPNTGNAFAFVRFENVDMAFLAKKELSGQFFGRLQCKIGYGKSLATSRVWVGGLGSWCSGDLLWREFVDLEYVDKPINSLSLKWNLKSIFF